MSNQINEEWAEQEYQRGLEKMAGTDDEVVLSTNVPDGDDIRDNLEDR
jgi:hypothetical protein